MVSENWKKLLANGLSKVESNLVSSSTTSETSVLKKIPFKPHEDPALNEIIKKAVEFTAEPLSVAEYNSSKEVGFDSDGNHANDDAYESADEGDILDRLEMGKQIQSCNLENYMLAAGGDTLPSNIMAWFTYLNQKSNCVGKMNQVGKYIALDCEMVGVGSHGRRSALARVSIVNFHGHVILDQYIRPNEKIVNFRTKYSGITQKHMKDAIPFSQIIKKIKEMIHQKVIIGHDLNHDLKCLHHFQHKHNIRDTSKYIPFLNPLKPDHPPSLKSLARKYLGLTIQTGSHDSVEDACVTMLLYRLHKDAWEDHLQKSITIASLSKQLSTPLPTPNLKKVIPLSNLAITKTSETSDSDIGLKRRKKYFLQQQKKRKLKRHDEDT